MAPSTTEFKKQAESLKTRLNLRGIELSGDQALDGLAAAHGFRNWHACAVQLLADAPVSPPKLDMRKSLSSLKRVYKKFFTYELWVDPATPLEMGIDRTTQKPVELADADLINHLAVVGCQFSPFILSLLDHQQARSGGWIFIDAKVDWGNSDYFKSRVQKRGVSDSLQILDIHNPEQSHTYNPLAAGTVTEVADKLMLLVDMPNAAKTRSPLYPGYVKDALIRILEAMQILGLPYTLGKIEELLCSGSQLQQLCQALPLESLERKYLSSLLKDFNENNSEGEPCVSSEKLKEMFGPLAQCIGMFTRGNFSQVLNTSNAEIDLYDTVLNKKYLYAMLPTTGNDPLGFMVGKWLLADLSIAIMKIMTLDKIDRPAPPGLVYMDGVEGYLSPLSLGLPQAARAIQLGLVYGIWLPSTLAALPLICQNTWNKVFFKISEDDEAKQASSLLGPREGFHGSERGTELDCEIAPIKLQYQYEREFVFCSGTQRYEMHVQLSGDRLDA